MDAESTAFFAAHGIGAGGAGAGGVGAGGVGAGGVGAGGVAVMAASVLAASVGAGGVGAGGGGFGGGDAGGGGAGGGGDHVACAKNSDTATSGLFARFPKAFFCVLTNPFWGSICTCAFSRGNRHILDVGRPTFFFSCGLYSSLERSSVPPLSGRFSLVRAREGGLSLQFCTGRTSPTPDITEAEAI